MGAEASPVLWLGLILVAGAFLFVISRGSRKAVLRPDHYATALNRILDDDWDGALHSLRRATLTGQTTADVYITLGSLLGRRGDHATALQIHRSLTVRGDLTAGERRTVQRCLAADYRALGRRREALQVLQELSQSEMDPALRLELVREALACGDAAAADRALRDVRANGALDRQELARFLAQMGERCRQQEQRGEAKRYFQEALKEHGTEETALLGMGDLAYDEGDHESALYYWQKLAFATTAEVPQLYERLEKVYFDLGKFTGMERVYAQILEKRPRDQQALLAAARLAMKKGQLDEAETLLRTLMEIAPGSPRAFQMLAHLLLEQGKQPDLKALVDMHVDHLQLKLEK